jgi:hypothetical protein
MRWAEARKALDGDSGVFQWSFMRGSPVILSIIGPRPDGDFHAGDVPLNRRSGRVQLAHERVSCVAEAKTVRDS